MVDELLAAHDDTLQLAGSLALSDWHWEEHLSYLRDLTELGRAALTAATDCGQSGRCSLRAAPDRTRGARRCGRDGHDEGAA